LKLTKRPARESDDSAEKKGQIVTVKKRQTRCIDCNSEGRQTSRAALKPGPRCEEHWRAERRRRSNASHGNRIELEFGITEEEYWAVYEGQGRCCAVCGRAKGITKRLAVDHEHNKPGCDHPPEQGCRNCFRCLACTTCNRIVLGRYDVPALLRAIDVLENPPAQRILAGRK
jgi:hypothetical protein